jgi:hypothetical protein
MSSFLVPDAWRWSMMEGCIRGSAMMGKFMPRREHLKVRRLHSLISDGVAQGSVDGAGLDGLAEHGTIKGVHPGS